ncbi:hypothetical protein RJ55_04650 [Drechmeria coniospora]|nr:hypothetical protein RJ55_04650 [Drechmeria coniospora]
MERSDGDSETTKVDDGRTKQQHYGPRRVSLGPPSARSMDGKGRWECRRRWRPPWSCATTAFDSPPAAGPRHETSTLHAFPGLWDSRLRAVVSWLSSPGSRLRARVSGLASPGSCGRAARRMLDSQTRGDEPPRASMVWRERSRRPVHVRGRRVRGQSMGMHGPFRAGIAASSSSRVHDCSSHLASHGRKTVGRKVSSTAPYSCPGQRMARPPHTTLLAKGRARGEENKKR